MDVNQEAKPRKAMSAPFIVGVMRMEVEGRDSKGFSDIVDLAVTELEAAFAHEPRLRTKSLAFAGPHLTPGAGKYAPLDFLEIGLAEKLERDLPFLLIVTEVDLSSSSLAFTLALPSPLTNIAVISTRRLDPGFWGDTPDPRADGHASGDADAAQLRPSRRPPPRARHCQRHVSAGTG